MTTPTPEAAAATAADPLVGRLIAIEYQDGFRTFGTITEARQEGDNTHLTIGEAPTPRSRPSESLMSVQGDDLSREIDSTEELGCGCCAEYNYTQEQDQRADKLDVDPRAVAIADGLLTAGYHKPRVITTLEELDALPMGSVVLSQEAEHYTGDFWISYQLWADNEWHRPGRASHTHPDNFLPATVLYEPTPGGTDLTQDWADGAQEARAARIEGDKR